MGRRVSIAIGVQSSGGLVTLPGAVQGARDFAAWSRENAYDVHEFIDADTGPVRVADLFAAVQSEVDRGDVECLLLFFAGHGVATGAAVDFWLLSEAPQNPNEAVNVQHSLRLARRCGIPHVVFFADACRTQAGKQHIGIYGSSIFPQEDVRSPVDLDQFFAARAGDQAYETTPDEDLEKAFGLFSECVISALRGEAAAAVETVVDGPTTQAVTARSLRQYLDVAVPIEASRRGVEQFPDCWPGSYWPPNVITWVRPPTPSTSPAEASAPQTGAPPADRTAAPTAARRSARRMLRRHRPAPRSEPQRERPDVVASPAPSEAADAAGRTLPDEEVTKAWMVHMPLESPYYAAPAPIEAAFEEFSSHTGRDHFETASGLSFVGREPRTVVIPGGRLDVFREDERFHVRGNGPPAQGVVDLGDDQYALVALLPEFTGTVYVGRAGVDLILYEPTVNGRYRPEPAFRQIASRLAAHLRYGLQATALDPTVEAALYDGDHVPPTIAALAVYALDRAGRDDEIRRLVQAFVDRGQVMPFDVAQVGELGDDPPVRVVPSWPLMTQGWTYLTPGEVAPMVWEAHAALTSAAWATVIGPTGRRLLESVERGELG